MLFSSQTFAMGNKFTITTQILLFFKHIFTNNLTFRNVGPQTRRKHHRGNEVVAVLVGTVNRITAT